MSDVTQKLMQMLSEKEDRIIEIRRYLHQHPEVSFEETETAKYISEFYEDKDCDVRRNVGGNGLVVTIDSGNPGKTIAIRADFDALPITEKADVPFKSKNDGVMHACGHDGHTAYMMILAESLIEIKDQLKGKIVILHQHAEELAPGGAKQMIEDGALDGVDNVIGAHVMTNMKTGEVCYVPGNAQTGRSNFKIDIHGEGGHASSPHDTKDAVVAASSFVVDAQSVVSRCLNPFEVGSLSIGVFEAPGSINAINGEAHLEGDVRAMSEEARSTIEEEIRNRLDAMCKTFGVTYDLDYDNNYPVLYNDPAVVEFGVQAIDKAEIEEIEDLKQTDPQPPSEDFAYYAQERPSFFFYVGAAPKDEKAYPHHHPKFKIDEDSLLIAAKSMGAIVVDYLENDGIQSEAE